MTTDEYNLAVAVNRLANQLQALEQLKQKELAFQREEFEWRKAIAKQIRNDRLKARGIKPPASAEAPVPPAPLLTPDDIKNVVAEKGLDIKLLEITASDTEIKVKPAKYLDQAWRAFHDALKTVNAKWIPQGKESRWIIQRHQ